MIISNFTNAVVALYPNTAVIRGNSAEDCVVEDKQGNKIEINVAAVNAWVDPNTYKYQRVAEYPPLTDQLDALWKGGDDAAEMLAKIQAVKAKYPRSA